MSIETQLLDPGETLYSLGIQARFNRIIKAANGQFFIGGYASVSLEDGSGTVEVDMDGDDVDLYGLAESFKRMMKRESRRNLMSHHSNTQIGEISWHARDTNGLVWKSHVVFTPTEQYPKRGLFIVAELFDDLREAKRYISLMKMDRMLSLSIGGEAIKRARVCSNGVCRNTIITMDLHEISSCDRGKNRDSKSFILKAVDESEAARLLAGAKNGASLLNSLRG